MEVSNILARSLSERLQCDKPWSCDPMVVLSAIQSGFCGSLAHIPECLQRDRTFMIQAVRFYPDLWLTLPPSSDYRTLDFVKEAILNPGPVDPGTLSHDLATVLMEKFPALRNNRSLWSKIIESDLSESLPDLFRQAPESIRADSDLVRRAAICNTECLLYADPLLFENRKFLEFILEEMEWNDQPPLMYIPFAAQRLNPDLVVSAFSNIRNNSIRGIRSRSAAAAWATWVAPALWTDRTFVKAWFQAGGPYVEGTFPEAWKEDAELFVLLAEHNNRPRASFRLAAPSLKHSKAFMLQVVEHNPSLLRYASHKLQRDFDVIVTALASTESNTDAILDFAKNAFCVLARNDRGLDFIDNIDARVQQKLEAHAIFTQVVQPAMLMEQEQQPSSPLCMLNQGAETARGYTQCLRAYLDVPKDENELRILRVAFLKLSAYYEDKRKRHPFLRKIGRNNYQLRDV